MEHLDHPLRCATVQVVDIQHDAVDRSSRSRRFTVARALFGVLGNLLRQYLKISIHKAHGPAIVVVLCTVSLLFEETDEAGRRVSLQVRALCLVPFLAQSRNFRLQRSSTLLLGRQLPFPKRC